MGKYTSGFHPQIQNVKQSDTVRGFTLAVKLKG